MTRGEKFIQDMSAKGLDEEQLRKFVETGNCIGFLGLCCSDCPFKCRRCRDNAVIANYFKGEIEEETKMKASEIKEFPSARRNTLSEMREVIDAMESGKSIEYKYVGDSDESASWFDNRNTPPNFVNCVYRVKQEEPKKKWRPFDGITECHEAIDRHGAWVINTNNHQHCQIVAYDKAGALVAQSTKTYRELLDNFIFVNGFPCGEEEE